MSFLHSIKFRFILACIAFSIIVTICYGRVTFIGLKYNSDELFNWYITQEATQLIEQYQSNPQLNLSLHTTAIVDITTEQQMIDKLATYFPDSQFTAKRLIDVHNLGPAFNTPQGYTIYEFGKGETTIHILEYSLNSQQLEKFYYLVDVSKFHNYDNYSEDVVEDMFVEMLALIMFIGLLIGVMLAKTVVSPLSKLAKSVDNMDYSSEMTCKDSYFNDEISLLAGKIDSFVARTKFFVEREKSFTRDASHELRTPVASSRAAIELALSTPEGQQGKIHNFLKRVERSNKDMTHLIETFLILGREDGKEPHSTFNLNQLTNQTFEKHDYLKRHSDVVCVNNIAVNHEMTACKQHLCIVLDNLVRNALQHTLEGTVVVSATHHQIIVEDTGEGFDSDEQSNAPLNVLDKSGVGLSIVKRLCEKQGWQLNISNNGEQGTRAAISLDE